MVTYYNRRDLVAFGNYLLSEERRSAIIDAPVNNSQNMDQRMSEVSHADIENWKYTMAKSKEHPTVCI